MHHKKNIWRKSFHIPFIPSFHTFGIQTPNQNERKKLPANTKWKCDKSSPERERYRLLSHPIHFHQAHQSRFSFSHDRKLQLNWLFSFVEYGMCLLMIFVISSSHPFLLFHTTVWMEWMEEKEKERKKSMLKCKFSVYIPFMFVCFLGMPYCGILLHMSLTYAPHTLMLMNLTCSINSHRRDSMMSSMILPLYFSFRTTTPPSTKMNGSWIYDGCEKKEILTPYILSRFQICITKAVYYWRLHSHSIPFAFMICMNTDGFSPFIHFFASVPAYRCIVDVYEYERRDNEGKLQTDKFSQSSHVWEMRHLNTEQPRNTKHKT